MEVAGFHICSWSWFFYNFIIWGLYIYIEIILQTYFTFYLKMSSKTGKLILHTFVLLFFLDVYTWKEILMQDLLWNWIWYDIHRNRKLNFEVNLFTCTTSIGLLSKRNTKILKITLFWIQLLIQNVNRDQLSIVNL